MACFNIIRECFSSAILGCGTNTKKRRLDNAPIKSKIKRRKTTHTIPKFIFPTSIETLEESMTQPGDEIRERRVDIPVSPPSDEWSMV